MIKTMIIAVMVFVSVSVMLDASESAPARSITESIPWMMPSDVLVDVGDLFISPAEAVTGTSTAFLASIYFILFAAWDHFIDGLRPSKINGLATDNINAVNGVKQ